MTGRPVGEVLRSLGVRVGDLEGLPAAAGAAVDVGDAYRGAMIGTAIGDALGRPAEGRDPERLRERFGRLSDFRPWHGWQAGPRGTFTDDTQMTICVAESVIAGCGRIDPDDLARRFVDWLPVGRGKGRATTEAVENLLEGRHWSEAGVSSAGNGAAMRAAPVGLAQRIRTADLVWDAALSALVTHAHPMAVSSAVAHAFTVGWLTGVEPGRLDVDSLMSALEGVLSAVDDPGDVEREWQYREGKDSSPVRLVDRLVEVRSWTDRPPEDAFGWFHNGAFVLESLPAALWSFLRAPDDPEEVIVTAVMGGHDADTVASMAGAYVGAYLGESAFPERWRGDDLEDADRLRDLGDRLLQLAESQRGGS